MNKSSYPIDLDLSQNPTFLHFVEYIWKTCAISMLQRGSSPLSDMGIIKKNQLGVGRDWVHLRGI